MKKIKELAIQLCKFGAVGMLCFGIDYSLMVLLTEAHFFTYFASSAISFSVSVVVNYVLSMRYVFDGRQDMTKGRELAVFVGLSLVGLLLNQVIMWATVEWIGMFYMVAKIFSTAVVTGYNFVSRKLFLEESRLGYRRGRKRV